MRPTLLILLGAALASAAGPKEKPITVEDRSHWAFRAVMKVEPPNPKDPAGVRNPIDRFIRKALDDAGLKPSPEASRSTLIRRLTFDLTGLPPTPEAIDAYLGDNGPDAYERVVDRLLASPRYGERQAQHWLDLARYADTDGYEFDQIRPNVWRYRDWVVDALNRDLPYSDFVRLQIAGDEIAPDDPSAFIATGFNRCYPDMVDQNDQGLRRQNALNDITETTGLVFLGLTIGCARCHDHKFDPIRQTDFYRLQAFFTPARFRDNYPISGPEKRKPLASGIDETGDPAPVTYLLKRGDFHSKGSVVEPGFPVVLVKADAPAIIEKRAKSTGRRTALADWLVSPSNPMTVRVMVNRLWQGHFGRGLVASPSDFGLQGDEPTHPELLDWLAGQFVDRGWSLKAIHRLMVTSATYRQTSLPIAAAEAIDPANDLLWRQNRRRLDGEAIRDALLATAGTLNLASGGPCVFPELPAELTKLSSKGAVWPVSPVAADRNRRSLYVFTRRNLRYPFFEVFDRPDTNASCPRRPVSTIAPQALTLLNGKLARDAAIAFAARVDREPKADRIKQAFLLALGRKPVEAEARLAEEFLDGASLEDLCLAIMNLNEFVYID